MKTKPSKTLKYIRIQEKKSKYNKDVFYGVLRTQNDGIITAMVVNPEADKKWIYLEEFKECDFDVTESCMEDVKHFFKTAHTQAEKDLDGAEFDLRDKKRCMVTSTERFTEYFQ